MIKSLRKKCVLEVDNVCCFMDDGVRWIFEYTKSSYPDGQKRENRDFDQNLTV